MAPTVLFLQVHQDFTEAEARTGEWEYMESSCCKTKGERLLEIKKCKGSYTCLNPKMNKDHGHLDYISTMKKD